MAQQQYTLFKKFIGYGHYKLIIADKEGTRMEAVTGDMDLISRLSSELEEEREKATKEAIIMCCRNRKKYCIFVRDNAGKMTNSSTCFTYVLH